jgi:TPR repeat protein
VIDRHLINLIWARVMLGVFYEEGRAPPVDYAAAAKFYQKSIDTQFVDNRGCVRNWPLGYATLMHLAGFYAYGLGVPWDRGPVTSCSA